ncbi:hypothetical protein C3943_18300 [Lysinibacillus sp. B2A1]|nr:hypothetical protein C3943_18300 [Lysinibacillus sp. B2A1]
MKYLFIGTILSIIGVSASMLLWGMERAYFISGIIGCILIVVAMIMSGSMVSGDRMRANFATETREHRDERNKFTANSFLMAVPNILITIILYYFVK